MSATTRNAFQSRKSIKKIKNFPLIDNGSIFFINTGNLFIFTYKKKSKIWEIKADQLPLYNIENLYKLSVEYFGLKV